MERLRITAKKSYDSESDFDDVISSVNVEDYDSEFDSDVDVRCADLDQKDCKDAFSSFGLLCNWNEDTENCDKGQPHDPDAVWIRTTESDREWRQRGGSDYWP